MGSGDHLNNVIQEECNTEKQRKKALKVLNKLKEKRKGKKFVLIPVKHAYNVPTWIEKEVK
jgi:hypothetical protein